jgi:hypothetical protein
VVDTGIGISEDIHEQIFERFSQAELTISREYEGAGLGLSISKSLIDMMGGEIHLKSIPGKGSTFYFTLPYETSRADIISNRNDEKPEKDEPVIVEAENITLLIAEDDYTSFLLIQEMLDDKSFTLLNARNGKEVVDTVENRDDIDLVLMDIKMPVMNGYDATKEIKKMKPDLPVIAQTAFASNQDKQEAFEAGCDEYVAKPISEEKFFSLIHSFI